MKDAFQNQNLCYATVDWSFCKKKQKKQPKPSSNIQVYAKLCGLKCRTHVVQNQDGGTNPDLLP